MVLPSASGKKMIAGWGTQRRLSPEGLNSGGWQQNEAEFFQLSRKAGSQYLSPRHH